MRLLRTIVRPYVKGKGSPILEHRVPELIPVLGSQTAGKLYARPAVTSPAAEHYRPLAGTKLYCLVTEAHVC